jgi:hypothetical protein
MVRVVALTNKAVLRAGELDLAGEKWMQEKESGWEGNSTRDVGLASHGTSQGCHFLEDGRLRRVRRRNGIVISLCMNVF